MGHCKEGWVHGAKNKKKRIRKKDMHAKRNIIEKSNSDGMNRSLPWMQEFSLLKIVIKCQPNLEYIYGGIEKTKEIEYRTNRSVPSLNPLVNWSELLIN